MAAMGPSRQALAGHGPLLRRAPRTIPYVAHPAHCHRGHAPDAWASSAIQRVGHVGPTYASAVIATSRRRK